MGLSWWFCGCICYLTILGIPWGRSCFVLGNFSFFPFGKDAIRRDELNQEEDMGTGTLGLIGNVLWFIFAGLWLAIGHVSSAIACAVTIIGIPFAVQHLKLASIALAPVGQTVVPIEVAEAARQANAFRIVSEMQDQYDRPEK